MRLPAKLALLLAGATCFPLALATAFTLPRGRQALRNQLDQIYAQDARSLAVQVHRTLIDKLDALTLAASTLRLGELDPEAREQALLLIYKETRGADVVGLFDSHAEAVGKTIQFSRLEGDLASEHEPADASALATYASKVPLRAALQAGHAIGPVYVLPDAEGRPIPRLVLGVAVAGARWVLAVEVSLRALAESFESFRPGESGAAFLLDGEGKVILHSDPRLMFERASLEGHPLVKGVQSDEWLGGGPPSCRCCGGRRWCRRPPTRRCARSGTSPGMPTPGSAWACSRRCCSASPRCARSPRPCASCARQRWP